MAFFGVFGVALVPLLLLLSLPSTAISCSEQEKGALLQFLTQLSKDNGLRTSWHKDTDCCKWKGITCSSDGGVIRISLASRGLEGPISQSLADLPNLPSLNLSCNFFTGGLPPELLAASSIVMLDVSFNHLTQVRQLQAFNYSISDRRPLQVLNISSNLFTGEFPSIVWEKNSNMVVRNASNNSFQGWMPSSFCNSLSSLQVLDLTYSLFSGNIPAGLGKCSALRVLKTGYNRLSGRLPDELFNASALEYLAFPNNVLHGTLGSSCLTNLRNLSNLDFGGNMLTGKIPDSIGQLKRLQELRLSHNSMSGELPSALSNCTNLIIIDLKSNDFCGELTKVNFSTLIILKKLDLLFNNLSGTIPESIYSCSNLTALRLSGNNLHGQLSPRIGNLRFLTFLSLSTNNFTNITYTLQVLKSSRMLTTLLIGDNFMGEVMPQDETIDGFQNLHVLSIHRCSLSGKIPPWLSKLKNLEVLYLAMNQLSGTIPVWVKNLELLFYLDISNNRLTGAIPAALMEMSRLKTDKTLINLDPRALELPIYEGPSREFQSDTFRKLLKLSYNNIIGAIPQEIGQLKSHGTLDLRFNMLSGEIPQQLCNLTNLVLLDLSSNHLTGAIPSALDNLNFLATFNVSNNDLEGPIPTGGQFNTFPNSSFEGNPKLCGISVNRLCGSAEAPPLSILSRKQKDRRVTFVIAFLAFFGAGVLYDQLVLSRFFG